jgi:outer membrane protein assembly factor BamB
MATETLGPTVIIELGLDRGEPETYAAPTRSTVPDWFGPLMLAVLVLLTVGASAAPVGPPLKQLLSLPVGPADTYIVTDSGQLLAQSLGTVASYDLADGRQQWQTGLIPPTYRLRTGSGVVLLRPWITGSGQPSTTAVDMTTGATRWRHAGNVVTIAGSPALLAVSGVRTLSTIGRRIQGPIDAIDPATGDTRWRVSVPSTAVLLGVPGPAGSPPRMLLVQDNRTFALHDLSTGRLLATAPLPPADYGPENPAVAGGLILLRHPNGWGSLISAYDPVTLRLRWQRPAGGAYEAGPCGKLACLAGPNGVAAVDPANGAIRWYEPAWRSVEARGDFTIAYGLVGGVTDAVAMVDPDTGRVLVDLHGWRPLNTVTGADRLLVTRVVDAGARSIVAVARPGDTQPRLLSDLPAGTGDCQSAPERLICRSTAGELLIWAYRRTG